MGKIFGYARVSTQDQNLDHQIDALMKAGAAVIYKEKITGTKKDRHELAQLLKAISEGDSVVIYKLDRISRSTKHLIELAETFEEKKVNFISIQDSIDTSTAMGRFFFRTMASIAELERDIISERTKSGLQSARMRVSERRLVWETRRRAEEKVYNSLFKLLSLWLEKLIEEAKSLSQTLYSMLPRVKLTELLIEVFNWTGFDEHLTHASNNRPPKGDEKSIIMAALMAMGTNIGLTKMVEATPRITYHQMANTAQWRLHEDSLNKAQAILVNFQHHLSLAKHWGDGSTSSSDGMRVQVGVSSLHADANPHYGTGKGTTIYRFTSDQFSSFYTKVINTNARDAVHVIDGLLHHESELSIEEHYTDTAGYTDQVFGLNHILGFRFAPRMRDLSDSKLYVMDKSSDYSKIESILRGKNNIKVIQDNYDDVLRLAHSIREGKVSASLILGKFGSYSRQNKMATALREMGRIEKTVFILDYISNETLRRRVQRGLNKGEAMNGLARALFFGKRGEFRERGLQDQLQRTSALNILINAITVWNTVYLTEATKILKAKGILKEELLPHVSPLGWEHINFLGEYTFDLTKTPNPNELRPLKI